jgi:hypothetical protein
MTFLGPRGLRYDIVAFVGLIYLSDRLSNQTGRAASTMRAAPGAMQGLTE